MKSNIWQREDSLMFKLSPSSLSFLWDGCRHCFYMNVEHGITQPSIPIPSIFTKIAALLKQYSEAMDTQLLHSGLPPGKVAYGEKKVRSKPIYSADGKAACYIQGRFDLVVAFDDGSYGILDFKTSTHGSHADIYGRQLHAYAYALENPEEGALALSPISYLGLIYYQPNAVNPAGNHAVNFFAEAQLVEIKRDDASFMNCMQEVLDVLSGPVPPAQTCETCEYCKTGRSCAVYNEREEKKCTCCDWCNYRMTGDAPKDAKVPAELCPKCQGPMTLRNGKYGAFWSCNQYPECKGTRNVER